MVRAPCCEKMGLKKGPWSPEEDQILTSYIQKHGHANWRALPKQAGLLRCGKSCRLRWMNYLRPDIKRGNFTLEEEDTIIKLHEMLGNRWSAIAARLPGRTDNEIKNVWHTHLKKRLKQNQQEPKPNSKKNNSSRSQPKSISESFKNIDSIKSEGVQNYAQALSPQTSDLSTLTEASFRTEDHMNNSNNNGGISMDQDSSMDTTFPEIDESFWSDEADFPAVTDEPNLQVPADFSIVMDNNNNGLSVDDGMDFWYDLFITSGDLPELPEF